jgi:hypothetical protein
MKHFLLPVCAALALTACAKPPSSIAPMAVASSEYSSLSCSQLTAEYTAVSNRLVEAEAQQRDKVAADAVVVFLVLVPPSSMTGDFEAEVARYKGEKIALERALDRNGCR